MTRKLRCLLDRLVCRICRRCRNCGTVTDGRYLECNWCARGVLVDMTRHFDRVLDRVAREADAGAAVAEALRTLDVRLAALEQLKSHPWFAQMFEATGEQPKPPPTTAGRGEDHMNFLDLPNAISGLQCGMRHLVSTWKAEPPPQAKCETCGGTGTVRRGALGHLEQCPVCDGQRPAAETGVADKRFAPIPMTPPCQACKETYFDFMTRILAAQSLVLRTEKERDELRAEVERLLSVNVKLCTDLSESEAARDKLAAELAEARAERDVWSGKACEEEQAAGNGPCGACRFCLPKLLDTARRELAEAKSAYHESQGWVQTWRLKAEKAEALLDEERKRRIEAEEELVIAKRNCRIQWGNSRYWYDELQIERGLPILPEPPEDD